MNSSSPARPASSPSPAVKARLAHLRHYSNLSYLATHKSVRSNDATVRLPQQDAVSTAQEAHEGAVRRESDLLREKIRHERELLSQLPPPSTQTRNLDDLLTEQHLYSRKLADILPPPGELFTPPPDSPLNPLLLHRFLSTSIQTLTSAIIPETRKQIAHVKAEIQREEALLKDTSLLTTALRDRIESLENELHRSRGSSSDEGEPNDVEIAETIMQGLEGSYSAYTKAQRKFLKELSKFVNTYLAKLLAAEGMGGPVVGDDLDIEVDSGMRFDKSRKARRVEKGQQTIHGMFGKGKKRVRDGESEDDGDGDEEEREVVVEPNVKAAKELKGLLEELMNATMEAEQYVVLPEGDSAAARFLVRSNVAVFHPKDARRLRLVEFGRSVED